MNVDFRSVSLRREETFLLRQLLDRELPLEIHTIVTSSLPPKTKTEKLESICHDFMALKMMLVWTPADEEIGRAMRQLNTDGVLRLRELVLSQLPNITDKSNLNEGAEFAQLGTSTLATLDRALTLHTDTPLLPVRLDNPRAIA